MPDLFRHGRRVESVFQLLGDRENDMTAALGWALSQSPHLTSALLDRLGCPLSNLDEVAIRLQEAEPPFGITDIEFELANRLFAIIEAKRGWVLPAPDQLMTYAGRQKFVASGAAVKRIIVLSECTADYANAFLRPRYVAGIPVESIAWREVLNLVNSSAITSRGSERSVLRELSVFLKRLVTVQPIDSNLVYVVSLARKFVESEGITYADVVQSHGWYFHPLGVRGWPKEPPNYIAFRLDGKLLSIHHIEEYRVVRSAADVIPELTETDWGSDHFLYRLGPAFAPPASLPNGGIYPNGRYWCMLDTLFTASTIAEARDITKARLAGVVSAVLPEINEPPDV